ncbi:MAG: extracellular matrix regulator RemB [Dehalobacterium sp.]|jgi:hypothetical protein
MFIHIGKNIMVNSKEIIMILDYQKLKKSPLSQEFLENISPEEGESNEKNSTMIITDKKVYFSSIAPGTIENRLKKYIY